METVLTKEIIVNRTLSRLILVAVFTILIALGAFVRIPLPFTPVPLTLQTFFVLLGAALLGRNLGLLTQLSYIFLGILGIPVFSATATGLLYILGPTGGYILGFILAALFIGSLLKYIQPKLFHIFILFSLADFIILGCGALWLKFLFNLSFLRALSLGFIPFIAGDILKAFIASAIYLKLKPRLEKSI